MIFVSRWGWLRLVFVSGPLHAKRSDLAANGITWFCSLVTKPQSKKSFRAELKQSASIGLLLGIPILCFSAYQLDIEASRHEHQMKEIKALDFACEQDSIQKKKALDMTFATESGVYRLQCSDSGSKNGCKLTSSESPEKPQR